MQPLGNPNVSDPVDQSNESDQVNQPNESSQVDQPNESSQVDQPDKPDKAGQPDEPDFPVGDTGRGLSKILRKLKEDINCGWDEATYAIGGSVKVKAEPGPKVCPPIVIRWDTSNPTRLGPPKVSLPLDASLSESFQKLVHECQPATFAKEGEEVYNEEYRKAGKLDETAFSTNFCPYSLGIVDTIAQALLPTMLDAGLVKEKARGVRAELYKLNIYSGPSGKFKAHVDTPRAQSQFGSLVVCLPYGHEGGALVVRNKKGSATTFDWGSLPTDSIQWAAFYSDCEHEVLEVNSGHRVWIGVNCTHSYAHTANPKDHLLPFSLKGFDFILYEVFRALGLKPKAVPLLHDSRYDYDDDDEDEYCDDFDWPRYDAWPQDTLGERFQSTVVDREGVYEGGDLDERDMWGQTWMRRVAWLDGNPKRYKEKALMFMAYGNDVGSLEIMYSSAAIVAWLPPTQLDSDSENTEVSSEEAYYDEDEEDQYDEEEESDENVNGSDEEDVKGEALEKAPNGASDEGPETEVKANEQTTPVLDSGHNKIQGVKNEFDAK
ncbi:hypothetical protein BT63DRAFT_452584 [Microthyrium microscopicum]|uniref:Fe2OG dioxygenase domain-containing protein n=1 Tax=Microthyrium microscopicum TaxID=703497 RepID=A0A6A6UJZ9_9PEZI|nr:hypothetical protein BT63DRAFT_452584 [Microthyrium microscopicum]